MNKTFFTLLGLVGLAFILMSNNTGVASEAGKDRTGSPFNATGGQQCNACHSGATFTSNITHQLKDSTGAVVTEYYANHTYTYEVDVTSSGAAAFGFQSIALLNAGNVNAGTLSASSSNTKIKILSTTRRYAEQTTPSASGLFVMTWKAPVFGSGTVTFYSAGNAVNLNSLKTGDKATSAITLPITENTLSSVPEIETNSINVYPNPVSNYLTINSNFNGSGKIVVVSISGKVVVLKEIQVTKTEPYQLDASTFEAGTYFVSLIDNNGKQLASSKFIKK